MGIEFPVQSLSSRVVIVDRQFLAAALNEQKAELSFEGL